MSGGEIAVSTLPFTFYATMESDLLINHSGLDKASSTFFPSFLNSHSKIVVHHGGNRTPESLPNHEQGKLASIDMLRRKDLGDQGV